MCGRARKREKSPDLAGGRGVHGSGSFLVFSFLPTLLGGLLRLCRSLRDGLVCLREDALGVADNILEHRCLLANSVRRLVHEHSQHVALGGEDGLLLGHAEGRIAEEQAFIKHDRPRKLALRVALVHHVAFEPLRERGLGRQFGFNFLATDCNDFEVRGEARPYTSVCKHHGEYGDEQVGVFGALDSLNGHEFGHLLHLTVYTHLTLVQEYGCVGRYTVITANAESYVKLAVGVGVVVSCHNVSR